MNSQHQKIPLSMALALLLSSSCEQSGSHNKSTAPTSQGSYDVCTLENAKPDIEVCTDEFRASTRADGKRCYEKECAPQEGTCNAPHIKIKSAKPAASLECVYAHPVDL